METKMERSARMVREESQDLEFIECPRCGNVFQRCDWRSREHKMVCETIPESRGLFPILAMEPDYLMAADEAFIINCIRNGEMGMEVA